MPEEVKPQPIPPHVLVLVITFDTQKRAINVSGPINDNIVCYGMMEEAKNAIRKWQESQAQQVFEWDGEIIGPK